MTTRQRKTGVPTRSTVAVTAAFGVNGLCFAAWLSRTPAVRDALALSPAGLGLLLLCLSGGACLGLPLAGPLVQRYGTARIVLGGAMLTAVGLTGLAVGIGTRQREPAAVGLLLTGLGMSSWDVSMNVAGAEVERGLGRSLMPRLHAAFSLGTVAGAGVGAFTAAYGIPVPIPILGAVALAPVTMAVAVRGFPAHDATTDDSRSDERPDTRPDGRADPDTRSDGRAEPDGRAAPDVSSAWREPRTLAIGLLTLCFAFTEGTANDWLAVALVDGHHSSEVLGAIGYGVFLAAMTVTRVTGGAALDRFGRVAVLRLTAGFALLGLLLVIIGPGPGWALAGAALWGVGAALGFPVGMSAASDDPTRAAARVGVVSAVAYTAFLGGPPLIGFLAERVGILWSLLVVLVALLVGLFVSRAAEVPGPAGAPGTPAGRRRRRR